MPGAAPATSPPAAGRAPCAGRSLQGGRSPARLPARLSVRRGCCSAPAPQPVPRSACAGGALAGQGLAPGLILRARPRRSSTGGRSRARLSSAWLGSAARVAERQAGSSPRCAPARLQPATETRGMTRPAPAGGGGAAAAAQPPARAAPAPRPAGAFPRGRGATSAALALCSGAQGWLGAGRFPCFLPRGWRGGTAGPAPISPGIPVSPRRRRHGRDELGLALAICNWSPALFVAPVSFPVPCFLSLGKFSQSISPWLLPSAVFDVSVHQSSYFQASRFILSTAKGGKHRDPGGQGTSY